MGAEQRRTVSATACLLGTILGIAGCGGGGGRQSGDTVDFEKAAAETEAMQKSMEEMPKAARPSG